MEIYYQGKIERRDFFEATALHLKPPKISIIFRILAILIVLYSIIYLVIKDAFPVQAAIILSFVFIPVLSMPWWMPYTSASAYNRPGNIYREPISGIANEEGITIVETQTTSNSNWNAFMRYKNRMGWFYCT